MKNKRLLFITIGLFMTIACLLTINVLFPADKVNKKEVLLTRTSTLKDYFKNDIIRIIPDSELNSYEIEERDKKTTDELNNDKAEESKRNYKKTYFMYNMNNEEIEIVGYKGNNRDIIIPTKIDGYSVVKINISGLNNIKSIFIPDTVNIIEGHFEYENADKSNLIIINIIAIIAFVIYTIVIGTLSNKNLEENFYNSTTYIFSIIYLIVSLILCFNNKIVNISLKTFYVTYGIVSLIYVLLMISMRFYKSKLLNNNKRYNDAIKN